MTGLYIHVPFCVKKCHYCNFVITGAAPDGRQRRFLSALAREMDLYPALKGRIFDTLYVGGGTPSTLTPDEMRRFFDLVRTRFRFATGAEVTFEANPGDVTAERAALYRALGVNRISVGAQSFNDETLKKINRAHDARAIGETFRLLREAGFDNINLDLMLSLPDESLGDVRRSLEAAAALGPEHVSLYELTVEPGTEFGRRQEKGTLGLPEEWTQFEMLSTARKFLKAAGFDHYELLNYAKPGRRSRHNLLYWANAEYLGLGPGATSYLGGRRFRRADRVETYFEKMEAGDPSFIEDEKLTAAQKETESLLLALRLTEGAEIKPYKPLIKKICKTINELRAKGLLEQTDERLRLTPQGQFFAETVFTELSSS